MKKYLFGLIFLSQLFSCIKSCDNKPISEDVLILGTNANYPPYESINTDGETVGFDIDVAKAIADKLKRRLVIQEFEFDALLLALQQGKVDMIMAGMSITPTRLKEIDMYAYTGEQVRHLPLLFWKAKPSANFDYVSFKAFAADKVVTVQSGTYMHDIVAKMQLANLRSLPSPLEQIVELKFGKSQIAIVDPPFLEHVLQKNPDLQVLNLALQEQDQVLGIGIGVSKKKPEFSASIQNIVTQLKNDGTLAQLENKWGIKK